MKQWRIVVVIDVSVAKMAMNNILGKKKLFWFLKKVKKNPADNYILHLKYVGADWQACGSHTHQR